MATRRQAVALALVVAYVGASLPVYLWSALDRLMFHANIESDAITDLWRTGAARDAMMLVVGVMFAAFGGKGASGLRKPVIRPENRVKILVAFLVPLAGGALHRLGVVDGGVSTLRFEWSAWVLQPLAQELMFSGFLLGTLVSGRWRWKYSWLTPVLMTTAAFGVWHLWEDWLRLDIGLIAFRLAYTCLGYLLYCWLRLETRSIALPVALHTLFNLITIGPGF